VVVVVTTSGGVPEAPVEDVVVHRIAVGIGMLALVGSVDRQAVHGDSDRAQQRYRGALIRQFGEAWESPDVVLLAQVIGGGALELVRRDAIALDNDLPVGARDIESRCRPARVG